jgi:hypothetical protein
MRSLFLTIATTVALSATAQELTLDKVDEFTGSTLKLTKDYTAGKSLGYKLFIGFRRVDSSYGVSLWSTGDQGCAGAVGNYAIFLDANGNTIKLDDDISDVDCADMASSVYVIDPSEFESFVPTKIRFAQSEGFIDYPFECEFTIQQLLTVIK